MKTGRWVSCSTRSSTEPCLSTGPISNGSSSRSRPASTTNHPTSLQVGFTFLLLLSCFFWGNSSNFNLFFFGNSSNFNLFFFSPSVFFLQIPRRFPFARRPGTRPAASPLVRHMLLVDPAKRANVEDICSHWYKTFSEINFCPSWVSSLTLDCFSFGFRWTLPGGSMRAMGNPVWKWPRNWPIKRPSGSIYSSRSCLRPSRPTRSSSAPKRTFLSRLPDRRRRRSQQ